MIRLGIDTGGTYTDAVVIDTDSLEVLAKAKALTTKEDLARGITAAMDGIPHEILAQADHVALSTTLATNACVEGKGGRAKLIIVGTTDEILRRVDAERVFGIPYEDVITTEFVGSFDGSEVAVPDWEALYESNPSFFENAESFGIASLYALNNGAIVEHSCADFLKKRFGKLVVEATTVAVEPNVIGRGATALLNARLVPVIEDFLDAIDNALAERGLSAPVSVVRSDGTLMSAELARTRPVETILSGPAASVTGAQVLSNASESLIVDIGGTTSDMSVVHEGRPNRTDGIIIGGWKTQVAGVAIDTIALGGDTVVRYTKNSRLELGTRKVTPLCIAASRWPSIKQALKWYLQSAPVDFYSRYEFLYLMRNPRDLSRFREPDQRLIEILREGPLLLYSDRAAITGLRLQQLEDEGVVMRCGFTPTDAMHLKGDFDVFDVEASQLGARCILKSYRGKQASEDEGEIAKLADEVYELAEFRLFEQALGVFSQDMFWPKGSTELDSQMHELAKRAWQRRHDDGSHTFDVRFSGDAHFIGIGAPTHVFLEEAASALHVPCVIPEHAEVANAIGAAASRVVVETTVRVNPIRESSGVVSYYQVCGSEETLSFEEADRALEAARELARKQSFAEARRRGAVGELDCTIKENRVDYLAMGTMTVVREWTVSALVG
ncbi:MAG: hydantoinase/oxoprolinase family protein [Eggerthellaceae bacterium]|nr:hydantoinase/oxoprolinase family protein [Eggerthellaceae bacterium]